MTDEVRYKRWVVTGSRHGVPGVAESLDRAMMVYGMPQIVHVGDARGVDAITRAWCQNRGITMRMHSANWGEHGRRAGPMRNKAMIDACESGGLCIGFPHEGSRGTQGCMSLAADGGLDVIMPLGVYRV